MSWNKVKKQKNLFSKFFGGLIFENSVPGTASPQVKIAVEGTVEGVPSNVPSNVHRESTHELSDAEKIIDDKTLVKIEDLTIPVEGPTICLF